MYFLYVDESGDIGLVNSPTRYFVLSGLVVHELRWHDTLDAIIAFRKHVRASYGLRLRDEIHAQHFIHDKKKQFGHIRRDKRLRLLRDVVDFEASLSDISIINILVHKIGKHPPYDVLIEHGCVYCSDSTTQSHTQTFQVPKNVQDYGLVIADKTDELKLRKLARRLRRFNPVPNIGGQGSRPILLKTIVEDPVHRDSLHSYFIQMADVNAYLLTQQERACRYVRKKGGKGFFADWTPFDASGPPGPIRRES